MCGIGYDVDFTARHIGVVVGHVRGVVSEIKEAEGHGIGIEVSDVKPIAIDVFHSLDIRDRYQHSIGDVERSAVVERIQSDDTGIGIADTCDVVDCPGWKPYRRIHRIPM